MKPRTGNRRVVVTGLGVISSIGIGWPEFWKNLIAGKSGITKVESIDTSQFDRHYGGEVKNFDPTQFMSKRKAKSIGRASQMAIAAAKLALKDAGLEVGGVDKENTAICVGTTTGEIGLLEDYDELNGNILKNFTIQTASVYPSNSIAFNLAHEFNLKNESIVFSTACASANYAVGEALDLIRRGKADCALAGGADGFSRIIFTGFNRLLSVAPEKCQPFDRNREGMIPAEASGIIILESLESAIKRNATPYAEIVDYGLSCDGKHMTNPSIEGVTKAIGKTINKSKTKVEDVGYINAHGTGTKENDFTEAAAYRNVFGSRIKDIPISSIKSMLGHTMGAAASLETIACLLALKTGNLPPNINLEEIDEDCGDIDVLKQSKETNLEVIVNNSQAFGGNNCCLIMKRFV